MWHTWLFWRKFWKPRIYLGFMVDLLSLRKSIASSILARVISAYDSLPQCFYPRARVGMIARSKPKTLVFLGRIYLQHTTRWLQHPQLIYRLSCRLSIDYIPSGHSSWANVFDRLRWSTSFLQYPIPMWYLKKLCFTHVILSYGFPLVHTTAFWLSISVNIITRSPTA
jgi:hypothetical protein